MNRTILNTRPRLVFLLAGFWGLTQGATLANVTVTAASGGTSISADTAADAATPGWVSLGTITVAEPSASRGDIGAGTLVLRAPAGFIFDTGTLPSISFTQNRNITAASLAFASSNLLTVTLSVSGTDATDSFSIGSTTKIRVRPVTGTQLPTGTIHRPATDGGTAVIVGVNASANADGSGGTSFGRLTEVPGTARRLGLASATPGATLAGALFAPQPVIRVEDQFGNLRASDSTTVVTAAASGGSASLQGTLTNRATSGVATFATLSYNLAETISLRFTSGSLTATNTGPITVTPAAADRLEFSLQPLGGAYGSLLSQQPVIRANDRFGNDSTVGLPANRTVTITLSAGSGTLLGTRTFDIGTAAGNGVVTCTNLQVSAAGSDKRLTAAATGLTSANSAVFTVDPAPLAPSVQAADKTYDGTNTTAILTRSLAGIIGSDAVTLTGGIAFFGDKNAGTNKLVTATNLVLSGAQAGNYTLVPNYATNYASIAKAALTIAANALARSYGTTNPPLTLSYTGLKEPLAASGITGAAAVSTTAVISSPPGAYPITVEAGTLASQNYHFSFSNALLTVSPAPLVVAADNKWKILNAANPPLTVSYLGLVNGETTNVLSGAPTLSTTATTSSPLGAYPITVSPGTLASPNYTLSFANGTLSVLPSGALWHDEFTRPTEPGLLPPWIIRSGTWTIASGVLKAGPGAPLNYATAYITNSFANFGVQARIALSTNAYGGGISGRLAAGTGARYAAWVYPENSLGGSNVLKLIKFRTWSDFGYSNVVGAPVAQALLPPVGTNWHTLKMVFGTNRIGVLFDGVRVLSATDTETNLYETGSVALEMWSNNGTEITSIDEVLVSLPVRPRATNDAYSIASGATLTVPAPGVLANDYSELAPPTAVLNAAPTHGTLSLSNNGSFVYTPTPGYVGPDSFTYRANDGTTNSSSATVNLTVTANRPPVAGADAYTAIMGTLLRVADPGVLENDSDPDGTPLQAVLVSAPANGALNLNPGGGFTYSPMANFFGTDTFVYRANDGLSNSLDTVVTVTVNPASLLFSDDFSRATNPPSLAPWVVQSGAWALTNGVLQGGTNSLSTYAYVFLTNLWTDYSVQARLRFPTGAYGGGIGGRLNRGTGAHYAAWVYPGGSPGGSNLLKLVKFQTWQVFGYTNVLSVPMAQRPLPNVGTDWHTLKVVFEGPRITAYFDGAQAASVTDIEAAPYLEGGATIDMWTHSDVPWLFEVDDFLVSVLGGDLPPAIVGIAHQPDTGRITVTFRGAPGSEYLVLTQPQLASPPNWVPVSTNTADAGGFWTYSDWTTNAAQRFYRAGQK